jgi:hypothetical protein
MKATGNPAQQRQGADNARPTLHGKHCLENNKMAVNKGRIIIMKRTMRGLVVVLLAASGTMLQIGAANAKLSLPEREHVQTIVVALEFLSFVVAVAIALFVWHLSKRASKNKKPKQEGQ